MINRDLLQKVIAQKKALQAKNEKIEQDRIDEVSRISADIARLLQERRQAIFHGLRLALDGIIPHGIEEDTIRRNEQITQLLCDLGYSEDYLSPIYDCPLCEDSCYAGDSKKTLCSCAVKRYQELLSGETFAQETQTFENFSEAFIPNIPIAGQAVTQRAYTRYLKEQCELYADSLPHGPVFNLLLYGGSGLGKTYLLRSIGVRASNKGIQTMALTANALLNHIRASYFARSGETTFSDYERVPLLLIDDLGTEPLWQGITVEQLFALLEHRMSKNMSTVISTNLNLTELGARYTERVMSRLLDDRFSKRLAFLGEDLRLRR